PSPWRILSMRIPSRALVLGALLAATPLSAAGAASTQPYHQLSDAGHLPLQPAGWSGDDDRRHRPRWAPAWPWNAPWSSPSWAAPGRGWSQPHWPSGRRAYLVPRPLPGWVIERRLRQQSFR